MKAIGTLAFVEFARHCPYRIESPVIRRRGNALNIEIGTALERCKLQPPRQWPVGTSVARWLLSGGDSLVLGHCKRACALGQTWCERCGHRGEHHDMQGKPAVCAVDGCACNAIPAGPCTSSQPRRGLTGVGRGDNPR